MSDERRDHADALVASMLDGDGTGATSDAAAATDLADAQLMHALLRHHHDDAAATSEARVDRVMAALYDDEPATVTHAPDERGATRTHRPRRRRRRIQAAWASVAAMLTLVATLWWIGVTNTPALAALDQAIAAADRSVDRTYRVLIESKPGAPIDFTRDALLYTRGKDRFVLIRPTPLGRDMVMGSNGTDAWFVSPLGTVSMRDSEEMLDRMRLRREAMLPFNNIHETLDYLTRKYDLTIVGRETIAGASEPMTHLRGSRLASAGLGPSDAEIWSHPDSGEVHRIVLHLPPEWSPSGHGVRVTFDLVSTESLPDAWYEPDGHR